MRGARITAVVLSAGLASAGCVGSPQPGPEEPVGYVALPLTAQGVGGAIYRLPAATSIFLGSGSFSSQYSLDAEAASLDVPLPPGNYFANLSDPAGDTETWPLTRENPDGTVDTVTATLDPIPRFDVTANHATSLAIRFHVTGVAPITFAQGSVEISIDVDVDASSFDITVAAPALTVEAIGSGPPAPATLAPRLPALGDAGDRYVLTAHTSGAWFIRSPNLVCAPIAATVTGGGNPGFVELLAEGAPGDGAMICVEQLGPQRAELFARISHQGPATTPLLLDLGASQFFIDHGITADFALDVFDGTTLHLEQLVGTLSASMNVFGNIAAEVATADGGTEIDGWYQVDESGAGTVTLSGD